MKTNQRSAGDLKAWIDLWSGQYPKGYDDVLRSLRGKESLGHDEAALVYEWKFRGLWPRRKIRTGGVRTPV
jgi:hypothetical protein